MSRIGSEPAPVFRLEAEYGCVTNYFEPGPEQTWEPHAHDVHELLWGARGTLTVQTADGFFLVPATLGLWIPAWAEHVVTASDGTGFHCTYFRPELAPDVPGVTHAVSVPHVVRELLAHLTYEELTPATRGRAERLACDLLTPAHLAPVDLPLPHDPRALDVAHGILEDPADDSSLEVWGRRVGTSSRTLSRLFTEQVGMNFAQWRIHARMRIAVSLLASGVPVNVVARKVGYRTPSAFVAVFRRVMGTTPGAYCFAA